MWLEFAGRDPQTSLHPTPSPMIPALVLLLTSALLAVPVVGRLRAASAAILPLPLLAAAGILLSRAPGVLAGEVGRETIGSLAPLDTVLALRLDGLGLLFGTLVCGIGALVLVYASGYFQGKPGVLGRFAAFAYLFAAAMLGLVLADDLVTLFISWELTSVASFLLIGLQHEDPKARAGAMRALVVTGGGGLALLVAVLLLAAVSGTTSIDELLTRGDAVRGSAAYLPILGLVALAAFTKSAQAPLHYWLPGAMAAPAPVSAFLHSATLVKAGVFLLARLHPVLGFRPEWNVLLGHAGALTLLVGAALAFGQQDLKRMLAYTTVAGLGTLVLLIGIGTEPALRAAMLFVAVHALYKASLFLVVGYLDKRTGTRDLSRLAGLATRTPVAFLAAALAALSMSGLPPLLGAIAKELVYEAKLGAPEAPRLLAAVGSAGSALVVACAVLAGLVPFLRRGPRLELRPVAGARLLLGPVVLAGLGLGLGLAHDSLAAPWIDAALAASVGEPQTAEYTLDASPGVVAWLGKATLAAGLLAVVFRRRLLAVGHRLGFLAAAGPTVLHDRALALLNDGGRGLTRIFTRGGVAQSVVWPLVGVAAVGAGLWVGGSAGWAAPDLTLEPVHGLLVLLVLVGALGAVAARSNPSAVASLGIAGFGVGMLFLLLGGPDLAMTQIAVETLAVLLLLSVLGRRPAEPAPPARRVRWAGDALALAVGASLTGLVWAVAPDGSPPALAEDIAQRSVPEAYGRNVVNVILVDFRALDTMGEVFVLAIAALGVTALLRRSPRVTDAARSAEAGGALGHSPILLAAARSIVPLLALVSIVLLLRGHHEPGGGFVGGLVAAAATLLHALAFGVGTTRRRLSPDRLLAVGLAVVLASGILGMLSGGAFLEGLWLPGGFPAVGKLGTPLLFDAGVFLVVLGVSTLVLFELLEREGDPA